MARNSQSIVLAASLLSGGVASFCIVNVAFPGSKSIGPQYNLVNVPIAPVELADDPANVQQLKDSLDRINRLNAEMERQGW